MRLAGLVCPVSATANTHANRRPANQHAAAYSNRDNCNPDSDQHAAAGRDGAPDEHARANLDARPYRTADRNADQGLSLVELLVPVLGGLPAGAVEPM